MGPPRISKNDNKQRPDQLAPSKRNEGGKERDEREGGTRVDEREDEREGCMDTG